MNKRLLLTGAGGFVGAHTIAHIMHNTDWDLICIDSFRHKGKVDRINEMLNSYPEWRERISVITHDLIAPFSDQTIHHLGKIDYIINMASESHVDRSIEDPVPFIKNNIDLTLNMLELARKIKPRVFIQISTDEVYGPMFNGYTHPEWDAHLPSNPYSASKAAQEDICYAYWRTYGVPVILTNTMNIIGEMQDPEKYIPMVIKQVRDGGTVTVHGTKDDIGSRYYLHARNQADGLLFILTHTTAQMFPQAERPARYNIVGERRVDNLEIAKLIAKFVDKPLKYELVDFHSTRPGHDPHYGLDGGLLRAMGWKPPVPFETSLRATVEWTLERPEWLL